MSKRSQRIPVMRPLLPSAEDILPYLQEIDQNRWYSNLGPLTFRFEEQLAELFKLPHPALISIANGTSALSVILRALDVSYGSLCVVPSWTFVATAAAATEVGMHPFFVDVDPESWALEPEMLIDQIRYIPGNVGAVIVVSPFGAPIAVAKWDHFTAQTGIPVIIDAAAGFDSLLQFPECRIGKTPVMVSLHATKPFGIGEGAFVTSSDKQLMHRTRQMSNFGFTASREIVLPGINAKLNEYQAAIGLAALKQWPEKRRKWHHVIHHYINQLEPLKAKGLQHRLDPHWVTSVCNVTLPNDYADTLIEQLAISNIESRKWWAKPCHKQTAYQQCAHFATPVTDYLANRVIALPMNVDMPDDDIDYIANELNYLL
jgi:dTDP-4-amino-4,6-dideoxygalactose transaminase